MKNLSIYAILLWGIGILYLSSCKPPQSIKETYRSQQILLVITPHDSATSGQLSFYEWDSTGWTTRLKTIPITVGRSGLAWGNGLHPNKWNKEPFKHEGDGKAPQGIYRISSLFGEIPAAGLSFSPKLPYVQSSCSLLCVDDPESRHYNRLIAQDSLQKDWKSYENMLRPDSLYEIGAVIDYNYSKPEKGAGSCIFLHVWRGASSQTAGCTAMSRSDLSQVLRLLDKDKNPLLIQLTQENYKKCKKELDLPKIKL